MNTLPAAPEWLLLAAPAALWLIAGIAALVRSIR